jgi:hypothetical protein
MNRASGSVTTFDGRGVGRPHPRPGGSWWAYPRSGDAAPPSAWSRCHCRLTDERRRTTFVGDAPGARDDEDEAQGVRRRAADTARRARRHAGVGEVHWGQGLCGVRGPGHRRQGRHDQGHHRQGQPARVPRRGTARANRAREVPDVHPALRPALPGRRRGRDLRPQLVQPRGRRARHGVLHRGPGEAVSWPWSQVWSRRWSTRGSSCSSTGSRWGRRSRPGASRAASTTPARCGSCPTWTCARTPTGTSTPAAETRCSPPPTRPGRRGSS